MQTLDKVWIKEGNVVYPGILLETVGEACVALKFDTAIWRRVIVDLSLVSPRHNDFSTFMFKVRKNLITVPIKFELPQVA